MPGSFSDYLENKIIDHVLGTASFTMPADRYIALFTVAPTDAGGGTEVSGGSYARVAANSWNAAAGGSSTNNGALTFPAATAGWGTVVAYGVFDASSGGNLLFYSTLSVNRTVNNGDTVSFANGAVTVSQA